MGWGNTSVSPGSDDIFLALRYLLKATWNKSTHVLSMPRFSCKLKRSNSMILLSDSWKILGNIFVGCESAGDEWWPGGVGGWPGITSYSRITQSLAVTGHPVSRGKVNTRPNINLEWTRHPGIMGRVYWEVKLVLNELCLLSIYPPYISTFDLIEKFGK